MQSLKLNFVHILALVIMFSFYRKLEKSSKAINSLITESKNYENFDFGKNVPLKVALNIMNSPAILMLNKYALNLTINFICNIQLFNNVKNRLIVFTFDHESYTKLYHSFEISVIYWPIPALSQKFKPGEDNYQIFQYFRAKLSEYLAANVEDHFWMIQPDTIWTKNLFHLIDIKSKEYINANIIFDSEGGEDSPLLSTMVAGGYYLAKKSRNTSLFFSEIALSLLNNFGTDNNFMTKQCIENFSGVNCSFIPYNVISNWRGADSNINLSVIFQFDDGDNSLGKLMTMKKKGFLFVEMSSLVDNSEVQAVCKTNYQFKSNYNIEKVYKNIGMRLSHSILEKICEYIPKAKRFILTYLFPYYAFYFVI